MTRRFPVFLIVFCVFTTHGHAAQAASASSLPNFVVIFIDDMGYGDIGPFGSTLNRTPHLDRMAAEGMRFTSFYAAPVCSVSRAQLLTGCYGARISVPAVFGPGSSVGLHPAENTIADLLKTRGYATMCVGKWHVGDQPEFLPTKQGFDHYFGIPYSNDMLRKSLETKERVVPLLRDDKVIELLTEEAQTSVTRRYTEEAVSFIREHKDKPFFLYFPHTAVHVPIVPGPEFQGKSQNGRFGDWVEEVDWSVGQILDTLRELKLSENTLVLFTSDNGPWLIKGMNAGTAAPLRGGKGSTWEGGVRVPTVAWWPGRVAAAATCDTVAGTIDILPTLAKLSGTAVPAEPTIDGKDMSSLLLGRGSETPREVHYYFLGYNLQAVRQGPWKLALVPQKETMGRKVLPDAAGHNPRLYNLDDDIEETVDLSGKRPDTVETLRALAEEMAKKIGGKTPTERRAPGRVEKAAMLYPAETRKQGKKSQTSTAKPIPVGTLAIGDNIPAARAPQVGNTPFVVSCEVTPQSGDGVVVSHGGSAVGYTLYLKKGRAVFAVRHGSVVTRIISDALPSGRVALRAAMDTEGKLLLSVNGKESTPVATSGLLPKQPSEDLNLGFDSERTVDDYDGSKQFSGAIEKLSIVAGQTTATK